MEEELHSLLFRTAWSVLKSFGSDPKWIGARTGMIAILHTWGQTLSLHPHLHCIVPGGGLTSRDKWASAKSNGKYLFPVKAMVYPAVCHAHSAKRFCTHTPLWDIKHYGHALMHYPDQGTASCLKP